MNQTKPNQNNNSSTIMDENSSNNVYIKKNEKEERPRIPWILHLSIYSVALIFNTSFLYFFWLSYTKEECPIF